jgi:hypothetical protein
MTKNPKYRLKEIAKNPLRIFWLFAHAVNEAVDTINDAVDLVRDVSEIIEPIAGDSKIGKTIKAVNDIADAVDAANNILEAVDQVAEAIGIEEPEKAAEPVEGE